MGQIATIGTGHSDAQLALIKRTVAKDCNDDEFSAFISLCKAKGLNPLERQIYAFVFNKDNPDKRQLTTVVAIDGMRSIADRTGDYRPDDDDPQITYDDALKSAANPLGIDKATVKVWKHRHGEWFKSVGSVHWDEFAPIYRPDKGGEPSIKYGKDQWVTMPRHMIAKCAEAQALRKAWPEDFSNIHAPEETHQHEVIDITPAEQAERGATNERLEKLGGANAIMIDWMDGNALDRVPVGQMADRALEYIEANKDEPSTIRVWADRNVHGLREFWAKAPSDALEVKKVMEDLQHPETQQKA